MRFSKKAILGILVLIISSIMGLGITYQVNRNNDISNKESYAKTVSSYSVVSGRPEKVVGPTWYSDSQLRIYKSDNTFYGYTGVQKTMLYQGTSVENLTLTNNVVIGPGPNGNFEQGYFDGDGAWLMSVWKDGDVLRGLYHAENCHYGSESSGTICKQGDVRQKTIAYTESKDGGKTFIKPNYPNNVVLSPDNSEFNANGDFSMIKINRYYYTFMYVGKSKICVARSNVSSYGFPGTWTKYYNGSFSEKGLGGRCTPIASGTSSSVVYSEYLNSYILITLDSESNIIFYTSDWANEPSKEAVQWQRYPHPIVLSGGGWWLQKPMQREGLISYPGAFSIEGDMSLIKDKFYLTYTFTPGGEDTTPYIIRRMITLRKNTDSGVLVPLLQYKNSSRNDTRETIHYIDSNKTDYQLTDVLGYVSTDKNSSDTTTALLGCYYDEWDNHFVDIAEGCNNVLEKKMGNYGSVFKGYARGLIPLYRCFDSSNTNHYLSRNKDGCDKSMLMGYTAPAPITSYYSDYGIAGEGWEYYYWDNISKSTKRLPKTNFATYSAQNDPGSYINRTGIKASYTNFPVLVWRNNLENGTYSFKGYMNFSGSDSCGDSLELLIRQFGSGTTIYKGQVSATSKRIDFDIQNTLNKGYGMGFSIVSYSKSSCATADFDVEILRK